MGLDIPSSSDWAIKCQNDGEFCLAARYWNGGINLEIGDQRISIQVNEGSVADGEALQGALTFKGSEDFWSKMLSPIPPRFFNEMFASLHRSGHRKNRRPFDSGSVLCRRDACD